MGGGDGGNTRLDLTGRIGRGGPVEFGDLSGPPGPETQGSEPLRRRSLPAQRSRIEHAPLLVVVGALPVALGHTMPQTDRMKKGRPLSARAEDAYALPALAHGRAARRRGRGRMRTSSGASSATRVRRVMRNVLLLTLPHGAAMLLSAAFLEDVTDRTPLAAGACRTSRNLTVVVPAGASSLEREAGTRPSSEGLPAALRPRTGQGTETRGGSI